MTLFQVLEIFILLNLVFSTSHLALAALRKFGQEKWNAGILRNMSQYLVVSVFVFSAAAVIAPLSSFQTKTITVTKPAPEGPASSAVKRKTNFEEKTNYSKLTVFERTPQLLESKIRKSADWILLFLSMTFTALFLRLLAQIYSLRKLLDDSAEIKGFGKVRVVVSEQTTVPFSMKLKKAWVVLPGYILKNNRDVVLAVRHELQHHRQHDTVWVYVIELLGILFFANPSFYFWKKHFTELQELACDEALIGRKDVSSHAYASCLIRVAEAALRTRTMYAGTACMASGSKDPNYVQCFLQRRISMLTNEPGSRGYKKFAVVGGTVASLIIGLVAFGSEIIVRNPDAPPNPGVVKFDPEIQKIANEELDQALKKYKAKGGTVVVEDPQTGRILAVADLGPAQSGGYTGLARRFQIASMGKMMVMAYAVEKGLTSPNDRLYCEHGSYKFGDHVYEDYKAFDFLTTQQTIAVSSNICTIKIGQRLGADGVESAIRGFGFGAGGTAAEFPTARPGVVPHASELAEPDYIASISTGLAGYDSGYVVTPLEVTQAFAAVANGGNLMKPVGIGDEPVVIRRVISDVTAEKMRGILETVVTEGTGHSNAESKVYTTAGKTASNPERPETNGGQPGAASFVGFAPVNSPKILVFVTVRDTGDVHPVGGVHAAPIFRKVAERVLKLMNVPPDKK